MLRRQSGKSEPYIPTSDEGTVGHEQTHSVQDPSSIGTTARAFYTLPSSAALLDICIHLSGRLSSRRTTGCLKHKFVVVFIHPTCEVGGDVVQLHFHGSAATRTMFCSGLATAPISLQPHPTRVD